MSCLHRKGPRRAQQGLTLLEVLVALVIASVVVTLLSQMLFQLSRLERRLDETGPQATQREWRLALLAELVRGFEPVKPGQRERFHGDTAVLEGFSQTAPFGVSGRALRVRLDIQVDRAAAVTRLELSRLGPDGERQGPVVPMLEWPGDKGSFAYIDADGQQRDEWSGKGPDDWPALPNAVVIRTGLPPPHAVLLLRTALTPITAPMLRDLERM